MSLTCMGNHIPRQRQQYVCYLAVPLIPRRNSRYTSSLFHQRQRIVIQPPLYLYDDPIQTLNPRCWKNQCQQRQTMTPAYLHMDLWVYYPKVRLSLSSFHVREFSLLSQLLRQIFHLLWCWKQYQCCYSPLALLKLQITVMHHQLASEVLSLGVLIFCTVFLFRANLFLESPSTLITKVSIIL